MVGRVHISLLRIIIFLLCVNKSLPVDHRVHGLCGGSFEDPVKRDAQNRRPVFKNKKIKKYSFTLEKDVPLIRPKNMAFRMKVWPTYNLYKKILKNETLKRQYYRVINNTVVFFENLLGRYAHNQTGKYNARDCFNPHGSDVFLETGDVYINVTGYDYHLVVDTGLVDPCGEESSTLGWAGHCANAAQYTKHIKGSQDIPQLIGLIYLCENKISGRWMEDRAFEQTVKHEVLHKLGINQGTLTQLDTFMPTVKNWTSAYGTYKRVFKYNISPLATEAARIHFNCSTLMGVEVEDAGGGGTSNSHWDMRVYGPELMVGMISRRGYFSNISLSFLRGLLWKNGSQYAPVYPWVNVSMKEDLWYGKNAGCAFVEQSCKEYIDRKPMADTMPRAVSFPFASTSNMQAFLKYLDREKKVLDGMGTCSPDRASVLNCAINHGMTVSNNETQLKKLVSNKNTSIK